MQQQKYKYLLYFISIVIIVTLAIQFYWNYKNYQAGKQQLVSEIQASLDNAVDAYYIEMAERNTFGFDLKEGSNFTESRDFDSILKRIDKYTTRGVRIDTIKPSDISEIRVISGDTKSRKNAFSKSTKFIETHGIRKGDVVRLTKPNDSLKDLFELTSRVIVAITTDTLNTLLLNNYIKDQFSAKRLDVDYGYIFMNNSGNIQSFNPNLIDEASLKTLAKSAYLPKNSSFELYFTNETATILKRNLLGMILSALLVASVVACLFFLLRIINRQKQLAELKNDLISNITHEFKTPISTVKVALEGIQNFNYQNDPEKTAKYLKLSHLQLDKLQMMVEKLLETATLDGNKLQLEKEKVNVSRLLSELVEKHKNLSQEKSFSFKNGKENIIILADPFHLENALNNILDNAVKYGGDIVEVDLLAEGEKVRIKIEDSGNSLSGNHAEQIFEKFYRVPSGNIHNVKGFGIGLYYTKQIVEKHGGEILVFTDGSTKFEILLPHE